MLSQPAGSNMQSQGTEDHSDDVGTDLSVVYLGAQAGNQHSDAMQHGNQPHTSRHCFYAKPTCRRERRNVRQSELETSVGGG